MEPVQTFSHQFDNYLRFNQVEPHINAIAPYFIDFILQRQLPDFVIEQWLTIFHSIYSSNNFYWDQQVRYYQEAFFMFNIIDDTTISHDIIFDEDHIYQDDEIHTVTDDEDDY